MIINLMHQGFTAIIPVIILLGFLIFVHELGHFLVAKWCGVRVEIFSLGFGKKILQYKKGDTNYCISIIPLGGYVKMFGDEAGAKVADEDLKYSFTHKNVWQRIAVVLAGPLMNFFFAILIYMMVATVGEDYKAPIIGDIHIKTTAYMDGFRSGDQIQSVNGEKVETWDDFQDHLDQLHDQSVTVEVKRLGSENSLKIKTTPRLVSNPNIVSIKEFISEVEGLSNISNGPMIAILNNSTAQNVGFKTGDVIESINGTSITYFRDLENILTQTQGQSLTVKLSRYDGKDFKTQELSFNLDKFTSLAVFGLESSELYLSKIVENSPAAKAGLKANDKIIGVNEINPGSWDEILNTVKGYSGEGPILFKIQRDDQTLTLNITPELTSTLSRQGAEEKRFTIGILPWLHQAPPTLVNIKTPNPILSFKKGLEKSWNMSVLTVVSFVKLATAKISPKNVGGIISIGQAASETFKMGITQFLQLMGLISINLFILNLLPIPVLDGGHLLFYSIEALRGAPLSMRKMEIAQQIGLVLLMSLMALSLFNDFSRVISSW